MSAILEMYAIDRQHLPAVEHDDDVVLEHGRRLAQDYDWSGYCMLYTLVYLEEQDISFDSAGRYTLLTPAHRDLLGELTPERHGAELEAFLVESLGDDEDEDDEVRGWAGEAAADSLRVLHDNLERLPDGDVLLVHVG